MSEQPQNGDLIKCDRCQACHRLTTPRSRTTGATVTGVLAFNCDGILRIGARNGKLMEGIELVKPVGTWALASEEYYPRTPGPGASHYQKGGAE